MYFAATKAVATIALHLNGTCICTSGVPTQKALLLTLYSFRVFRFQLPEENDYYRLDDDDVWEGLRLLLGNYRKSSAGLTASSSNKSVYIQRLDNATCAPSLVQRRARMQAGLLLLKLAPTSRLDK